MVGPHRVGFAFLLMAACGSPPEVPPEPADYPPPDTCDPESGGWFDELDLLSHLDDRPLRDGDPLFLFESGDGPARVAIRVGFSGGTEDLSCVRVRFVGSYEAELVLSLTRRTGSLASSPIYVPALGEVTIEAQARGRTVRRTLIASRIPEPTPRLARIVTPALLIAVEQNELTLVLNRPSPTPMTVVLDADRTFFASPSRTFVIPVGEVSRSVEVRMNDAGPIRFEAWILGDEGHPVSADVEVSEAQLLDIEIVPDHLALPSRPVRIEIRIAAPVADDLVFGAAEFGGSGFIAAGSTLGHLDVVRSGTLIPHEGREFLIEPRHLLYRGWGSFTANRSWAPPGAGDLALNEIHWNPTEDVGCDRSVDLGDQFVEIVNVSERQIDLSRLVINGAALDRVFNLDPHAAVIVFAGATGPSIRGLAHCPALSSYRLYDVALAHAAFVMTTSVRLERGGVLIAAAEWAPDATAPGESLQRAQDLLTWFGEAEDPEWLPHSALHELASPFSPGLPYRERPL